MAWRFRYDGHVYREGDVTVDQWDEICEALDGKSWALINPLLHPKDAKQIFRVIVAEHTGIEKDMALKTIGAMSTSEFLKLFDEVEDDLPDEYNNGLPHEGGAPSTRGSSTAPDDSGGPQTS